MKSPVTKGQNAALSVDAQKREVELRGERCFWGRHRKRRLVICWKGGKKRAKFIADLHHVTDDQNRGRRYLLRFGIRLHVLNRCADDFFIRSRCALNERRWRGAIESATL